MLNKSELNSTKMLVIKGCVFNIPDKLQKYIFKIINNYQLRINRKL